MMGFLKKEEPKPPSNSPETNKQNRRESAADSPNTDATKTNTVLPTSGNTTTQSGSSGASQSSTGPSSSTPAGSANVQSTANTTASIVASTAQNVATIQPSVPIATILPVTSTTTTTGALPLLLVQYDAQNINFIIKYTLQSMTQWMSQIPVRQWKPTTSATGVLDWTLRSSTNFAATRTIADRPGIFLPPLTILGTLSNAPQTTSPGPGMAVASADQFLYKRPVFVVVTMHSQQTSPDFRTVLAQRRGDQGSFGGCSIRMQGNNMYVLMRLQTGMETMFLAERCFPTAVGHHVVWRTAGSFGHALHLVLPVRPH